MKFVSPSQLDSSNPGVWPIYYKVLVWGVIIGLLYFLANQFLLKPAQERIESNDREISTLKADYSRGYQYTLDLAQYQERSKVLIEKLDDLLKYLPTESETAQLVDAVYKSATDSEINLSGFVPAKEATETDYYNIMPVKLETSTGFSNFAHFAQRLNQLERIMNVADFQLEVGRGNADSMPNADQLSVTAQLQTYVYNQDIEALRQGRLLESKDKKTGK